MLTIVREGLSLTTFNKGLLGLLLTIVKKMTNFIKRLFLEKLSFLKKKITCNFIECRLT